MKNFDSMKYFDMKYFEIMKLLLKYQINFEQTKYFSNMKKFVICKIWNISKTNILNIWNISNICISKYKKFRKYKIGKLKYFEKKQIFRNHENTSKIWNICTNI